jgi:multimeric flavodoxin WrbA
MMILALNGSPRRGGNTDVLLQAALAAAADAGATTELIQLGGLSIAECDGCQVCWQGADCVQQDDMNALYAKIIAADGVLFGTPVYWYGPTGLMKLLLDRMVYFNCPDNRVLIRGKRAAVIVPFEEHDPTMADGVLGMFRKSLAYLEMQFVGAVVVPGVTQLGEVAQRPEHMAAARELGRELVRP